MKEYMKALAEKAVKGKEDIIASHLPEAFDIKDICCHVVPRSKVEIYSHKGTPFLEVHPPVFNTTYEDGRYLTKATQNYRSLI